MKVNDKKWKQLKKKLGKLSLGKAHVRVGTFGGVHSSGYLMPELMATHEFGSQDGRIPQRSFIGATLSERRQEITKLLSQYADQILQDKLAPAQALGQLGLWAATAVKAKITTTDIPPPLKPSTIARKGSTKPLVDTGQLVNSITWVVIA